MAFFFFLRECGFDWERARRIFYNMNELQLAFISYMIRKMSRTSEFGSTRRTYTETVGSFYFGR